MPCLQGVQIPGILAFFNEALRAYDPQRCDEVIRGIMQSSCGRVGLMHVLDAVCVGRNVLKTYRSEDFSQTLDGVLRAPPQQI